MFFYVEYDDQIEMIGIPRLISLEMENVITENLP